MAMSVQQGDLPQEENTMKRLFAGTLALVMTCGLLFSGCGKQMTPEEEAASQEAAISQQLQDEENKTGLKRLISNNLTEYEQPVHDFIEGLQDGDAEKTATALGVPNTFGEKLQDWVVVNDFETFQKTDMTNICLNSAKEGSKAAINVFMKTPEEVTADTSPDYTLTAEYTNGAWVLNPPTGILTDYSFTVPNNKVRFQGTDLSSYTAKNAETGVWTVTLPRALDLDSDAAYVISTDMGDFNGRVYQVAADGNKNQMLLADIDSDTRDAYQSKLSAVMKEVYRLLSIGAGESDFSNVLLDSNEISNCVPEPVDSDDDVEAIQANADKKALGASVTSITVAPDDTIEGYPDAYTYRLDGNDGVKIPVELLKKISFRLEGHWAPDSKEENEKIFVAEKATEILPETESEVCKFLMRNCSSLGKTMASHIVERFGMNTLDVCAHHCKQLFDIPRIDDKVIAKLNDACLSALVRADVLKLLQGVDVSPSAINTLVETYGNETIHVLENNPYKPVPILGFAVMDQIALAMGEPVDSERRMTCATIEALHIACQKTGSMCAEESAILARMAALTPQVSAERQKESLDDVAKVYAIVKQGKYYYDKDDFLAERKMSAKIVELASAEPIKEREIEDAFIKWQKENAIILSPRQAEAVRNLKYRISIVTGGPGTGKTTCLRAIMDVYHMVWPEEHILLMAPTGLAAKRMAESTGI